MHAETGKYVVYNGVASTKRIQGQLQKRSQEIISITDASPIAERTIEEISPTLINFISQLVSTMTSLSLAQSIQSSIYII